MRNRTEYPANWYDEIRPAILRRDKYKCVRCGINQRQWIAKKITGEIYKIDSDERNDFKENGYKVYRIYLHVCHLNNDKGNCEDYNLITYCVTCHAKNDANYKGLIRKGYKVKNQLNILSEISKVLPKPAPATAQKPCLAMPPSAGIIVNKVA